MTASAADDPLVDDGWFRPFFAVDRQGTVRTWPDPTAATLGLDAGLALGRSCHRVIDDGTCRACRRGTPDARHCFSLPLPAGQGWMVWSGGTQLRRAGPGSALIEALLIRSLLLDTDAVTTVDGALEAIRLACAADDCEMFLLDRRQREVVLRACAGRDRDAFLDRPRMALGEGYPGLVTLHRRPLFSNHLQTDPRFLRAAVKQCGIRTFVGVPVVGDRSGAIGYLGIGWRRPTVPAGWAVRLAETLSPVVARVEGLRPAVETSAAPFPWIVRGFGPLELECGDVRLTQASFRRQKSADLIRHLLLAPFGELSRDTLIECLWPCVPPAAGANRLHVVLHDLRAALQGTRLASRPLVEHSLGRYRLASDVVSRVDIRAFEDALSSASALRHSDPDRALMFVERACDLYRGDLFTDGTDIVFEGPRERLRRMRRDAVVLLAELRQGHTDSRRRPRRRSEAVIADERRRSHRPMSEDHESGGD
jgi:hypothetical protein